MFPIEPDDMSGTWQDFNRHEFILDNGIDMVLKLRKAFEELPETSLVTTRKRLGVKAPTEMFWLVGSWEVPDYVTGSTHGQFVNPHHPKKWQYSPVFTRCDCGAMMKMKEGNMSPQAEHNNCPRYQRQYAKARISENRAAAMRTLLRLYKPLRPRAQILGYERINGTMSKALLIDISEEYANGRQLLANTAKELAKEHKPREIAEAYGVGYRVISRSVNQHTDTSLGELQEIRR